MSSASVTCVSCTSRVHSRLSAVSSLFFFYCSRAHRDLHSFPTRRSSDLTCPRTPNSPPLTPTMTLSFITCGAPVIVAPTFGSALDRKSTRLNSSHGSISYAVFCLKKKNNKKITNNNNTVPLEQQ